MGQSRAAAARLGAGVAEIERVLRAAAFERTGAEEGKGSGGPFARMEFGRRDRRLHLWLRGNSLSVRYELAGRELDHASYMRALLGPGGGNHFPSYSDDAQEAFAALRHDLEQHGNDFLNGDGDEYLRCWRQVQQDAARSGVGRLAHTERELGDR